VELLEEEEEEEEEVEVMDVEVDIEDAALCSGGGVPGGVRGPVPPPLLLLEALARWATASSPATGGRSSGAETRGSLEEGTGLLGSTARVRLDRERAGVLAEELR
jgi:hypothetical protein